MKIALIGFGTVGKALEKLIYDRKDFLKDRYGESISIAKILIRDPKKERESFDKNIIFTRDFKKILDDKEITCLVDLSSGRDEVYRYLKTFMEDKRHLVTANKSIVSKHFEELVKIAHNNKVAFLYEASVGGGVHIIKDILEDIDINNIDRISGILNGTCNYILSSMEEEGISYDKALKNARDLGYLEEDPKDDLGGFDARRKLRILSTLIFSKIVREEDIFVRGIEEISDKDIEIFKKENLNIRLFADSFLENNKYFAFVLPSLIKKDDPLKNVKSSNNIISYKGEILGYTSFYGLGAGGNPTGHATFRDIMDVFLKTYRSTPIFDKEVILSNLEYEAYFYIRIDKKFEEKFKDYTRKKYDLGREVAILTKKISLEKLLYLLKDSQKYSLAREKRLLTN